MENSQILFIGPKTVTYKSIKTYVKKNVFTLKLNRSNKGLKWHTVDLLIFFSLTRCSIVNQPGFHTTWATRKPEPLLHTPPKPVLCIAEHHSPVYWWPEPYLLLLLSLNWRGSKEARAPTWCKKPRHSKRKWRITNANANTNIKFRVESIIAQLDCRRKEID